MNENDKDLFILPTIKNLADWIEQVEMTDQTARYLAAASMAITTRLARHYLQIGSRAPIAKPENIFDCLKKRILVFLA